MMSSSRPNAIYLRVPAHQPTAGTRALARREYRSTQASKILAVLQGRIVETLDRQVPNSTARTSSLQPRRQAVVSANRWCCNRAHRWEEQRVMAPRRCKSSSRVTMELCEQQRYGWGRPWESSPTSVPPWVVMQQTETRRRASGVKFWGKAFPSHSRRRGHRQFAHSRCRATSRSVICDHCGHWAPTAVVLNLELIVTVS